MKLVYCTGSLSQSGGTERVITTKMNYFADVVGYKVYIVLLDSEKPFFKLSDKVELKVFPYKKIKKNLPDFLFEIKPDIVLTNGGLFLSFLFKIKDGSKKVLEFHFTKNFLINFVRGLHKIKFRQLHLLKVWLLQKRLQYYTQFYDELVLLTKRDMELWGAKPNITYIYNPLSFRSSIVSTTKNKQIIAVGSLTPAKGMDQLIHAFGRIAHEFSDWNLVIYGAGQDLQYLQKLIEKYNIKQQAKIYAPMPNIQEELIKSSIYAFPSRSDGFGLVLTEAMECGLPCVAFDCECGPREIVVNNETGILVPNQNINKFAEALELLMSDDSLREKMGHNAKHVVKKFYVESIMPKWINLFKTLTDND